MEEYTPAFTRALVDTLLGEFPPQFTGTYTTIHDAVVKAGDTAHIVIFDYEDGFDYHVADSLAAATVEIDRRYPDIYGWIVNAQNGYRYLITASVTIRPKPFDIITPNEEVHGD